MTLIKATERQAQVRDGLLLGLNNKQIAYTLGLSRRTIEDHRAEVYKRYGVTNAVMLVRKCYNLEGLPNGVK